MPAEQNIETFRKWVIQTGIPDRDIPSSEAVKTAFKLRQGEVVYNLVWKVRPRENVQKLRKIAALEVLAHLDSKMVPIVPFLKKDIQMYNNTKILNESVERSIISEMELRNKLEKTFALRKENFYKMHINRKISLVKFKANIMENKADWLHIMAYNEKQYKIRINSLVPYKANFDKSSDALTVKKMLLAKNYLKNFFLKNKILLKDYGIVSESILYLWHHLRDLFHQISNWTLWNAFVKASERLSRNIFELTKTGCPEKKSFTEQYTVFDLELLKTRTIFFNFILLCSKEERASVILSQHFITAHHKFLKLFCEQLNKWNTNEIYHKNISEYLEKANSRIFYNNKINYLQQEINLQKNHLYANKETSKSHQLLLNNTQCFYDGIRNHINSILQITMNLAQIKQKIIHTKNSLKYILNTTVYLNKKKLKRSNFADSFEISEALCSTKLDFENSLGNATIRNDANIFRSKAYRVTQNHKELFIFNFWSVNRSNCFNKNCFCHDQKVQKNESISKTSESIPTLGIQTQCRHTSFITLNEVFSFLQWKNISHTYTMDVNKTAIYIELKKEQLRPLKTIKDDAIAEILDEINTIENKTTQKTQQLFKFYSFTLENYLCKFIPTSKFINDRPYSDYDSEIKIYIRLT